MSKKYSTAKALIVDGVDRNASPATVDWILDPNTEYFQIDGTSIGITNGDSIFTFPKRTSSAWGKEALSECNAGKVTMKSPIALARRTPIFFTEAFIITL